MIPVLIYAAIFVTCAVLASLATRMLGRKIVGMRKTVTFGDESAVTANRLASVLTVFLLWGAFTGSKLLPSFLHAPAPFMGDAAFTYTLETPDGQQADARVTVMVRPANALPTAPPAPESTGPARDDVVVVPAQRGTLTQPDENDEFKRADGARTVAINGAPIAPGAEVETDFGTIAMSQRGALNIRPDPGLQMEAIWLPPPEAVGSWLVEIAKEGFRNYTLLEHLGWSMLRVLTGFALGALVGIPLG